MAKSNQKSIIFRYDVDEHPQLDEWLGNQSNRNQSIIYGLERVVAHSSPKHDLVRKTLKDSMENEEINLFEEEQSTDQIELELELEKTDNSDEGVDV